LLRKAWHERCSRGSFDFKAQEAICKVAISVNRDVLQRRAVNDIMPVPQGDMMEDFRLRVPDEVIAKHLYAFWHDHKKATDRDG